MRVLHIATILTLLVTAALVLSPDGLARDDIKLCPGTYEVMSGLDGRDGACSNVSSSDESYTGNACDDCVTAETQLYCAELLGTLAAPNPAYIETSGGVGMSTFLSFDKSIIMAGSVEPIYDDGRDSDCARVEQVYTIADRTNQSFPGLTNTFIALRLPSLCASGEPVCSFSTAYAMPILPATAIENMTQAQRDAISTRFPASTGRQLLLHSLGPGPYRSTVTYQAWLGTSNPALDDLITIDQFIYKPNNAPYFDITWRIRTQANTYDDARFYHAVDTFTSGNDFGYGYLCDVTKIAGGTGGSAFFQGTIALHPSTKQFEGWWGEVFHRVKEDDLPEFEWSTPLAPDPSDPSKKVVKLTTLDDNAIAQEWDDLEISQTAQYISVRWTFDDPILQSTHATPRSMFTVASDDRGYRESPSDDDLQPISPVVFDISNDPSVWRSSVFAYPMPKPCSGTEDCRSEGSSEICLESNECKGEDGCPKYCALSRCPSGSCSGGQVCVFGFCKAEEKWKTEDLANYDPSPASRRVFTFDTSGNRYWFTPGGALAAHLQTLIAADEPDNNTGTATLSADNLIRWVLGSLNGAADANNIVIDENESHDYDLHRPTKVVAGSPPKTVRLLRERYDDDEGDRWLLGDISHADPVYIGAHPVNGWGDVGLKPYSEFINSDSYQTRKPILLVSANDGMLHAYDAVNGEELWAFVPWDVLPRLIDLAKPFYEQVRTPTMDLRPVVHDAYDEEPGGGGEWRTVLMVGSRGGGDHYWAMEITPAEMHLRPTESASSVVSPSGQQRVKFMWYFADEDLGLTYSQPTSGRFIKQIPMNAGDPGIPEAYSQWLVFLGSGYAKNSAAQMQKLGYFYVLSMFDYDSTYPKKAKMLAKIPVAKCPAAGVCGSEHITGFSGLETPANLRNNVLSSATVADARLAGGDDGPDGFEDTVYIGDLAGHILRFTFDRPVNSENDVHGTVLFNTFKAPVNGNPSNEETLDAYRAVVENTRLQGLTGGDTDQKYDFFKFPRPISVRPVVWRTTDPDDTESTFIGTSLNRNKMMVFFGTGKYDSFYDSFDEYKRDPNSPACQTWPYASGCVRDVQTFYGIVDRGDGSRVTYAQLIGNEVVDTTQNIGGETVQLREIQNVYGSATGGDAYRGWFIDFNSTIADNRGEKIITEPVIWEQENMFRSVSDTRSREWIVFFTTFTPNMQGTCDIRTVNDSGGGFLMTVTAEFGGNPSFAVQDVSRNSIVNGGDTVGGSNQGYAGQKFTGSILSRVDVDPYQKVLYVKTGPDNPVMRIGVAGLPYMKGAKTSFYRIK